MSNQNYKKGYTCGEEMCLTRLHLEKALLALTTHDVAEASREGLLFSFELQEAIDVLVEHCGYSVLAGHQIAKDD